MSDSPLNTQRLMSVAEAAAAVGVSPNTLRREINARRIACYRVRGTIRISATQLTDYLKRHEQLPLTFAKAKRKHF